MINTKYDILVITGATATGKTTLASNIAYLNNGEVISADSRQVFKQMTLGTGKDYDDYIINNTKIPYHLIDIKEPGETYSVFQFHKIIDNNKYPIVCGGTGLYIESIIKRYKLIDVPSNQKLRDKLDNKTLTELTHILEQYKELHNKTDIDTKQRAIRAIEIAEFQTTNTIYETNIPELSYLVVAPSYDRPQIRKKITQRLKERLKDGMIDEVSHLIGIGVPTNKLISYGLEYKFITQYLIKEIDYDTMFEKLNIAIHQFAKRQMTWFRRMEKRGVNIHWIDGYLSMEEKSDIIINLLTKNCD